MTATLLESAMRRPLPTLSQWLDEKGAASRAEGFEEISALRDLAERTILQETGGLRVEEACFLRLWQGMCIATVELCNLEQVKKVPTETIITMLPRVLATAAMYAFASVASENTPYRDVAKLLTEEFRAAAKVAADSLTGKQ